MYAPCAVLTEFHSRSPWVMLPQSFNELGFATTLVCASVSASTLPTSTQVRETKVPTSRYLLPRLARAAFEPLLGFREIARAKSDIVIIGPLGPWLCTIIPLIWLHRVLGAKRTRFILKADVDLLDPTIGGVSTALRKALIVVASWTFDKVSVESHCSLDFARRTTGVRVDRVLRIPLGYPQGAIEGVSYSSIARSPVVLCVARVNRMKGQDILLQAFAPLASEFPDWTVRLVGPVDDARYEASLRSIAREPPLMGRVAFEGFADTPAVLDQECRGAAIFCLPTLKESAGQVKYEATACGLPVITTDRPCREDALEMGWIVVRAGNVDDLRDALRSLMRDPKARKEVADRAQSRQQSYLQIAKTYLTAVGLRTSG